MTPEPVGNTSYRGPRRVNPPSVFDEVVRELRHLILSGHARPGGRLVEERLTEQFGVSRAPLREALRILQQDGLVQSLPRRGYVVTPINADDAREIYTLRSALERLAVELGLPVTDKRRLQPMRDALELMRSAAAADDQDAILEANSAFHIALVALPGHTRLLRAYETLMLQMRLYMAYNLRIRRQLPGDSDDTVHRHQRLLDLVEAGEAEALLDTLQHHGDRSFLDHIDEIIGDHQ